MIPIFDNGKTWAGIIWLIVVFYCGAEEGSVFLQDGTVHSGKIFFNRPVYLDDIFRRKTVSLSLSQIYKISVVEEAQEFSGSPLSLAHIDYLMGISTWEGKSYWGKFGCRVSVAAGRKKHDFFLVETRETLDRSRSIREIVFAAPSGHRMPGAVTSLGGELKPAGIFYGLCALHHERHVIFTAQISPEKDRYDIADIMPGEYDLFAVGKDAVVFCLSTPLPKAVLDTEVTPYSTGFRHFQNWIEKEAFADAKSSKILLYAAGRLSDTRVIVMEEVTTVASADPGLRQGKRLFWLYYCHCKSDRWRVRKIHLLSQQDLAEPVPRFLLDPRLSRIVVPVDGGKRRYDCVWE